MPFSLKPDQTLASRIPDPRLLPLLVILLAIFCLSNIPFHPDFSAGQTITRRFLEGQRPYIDIIENNPPMTFYMHVPSALLERLTGIRGEIWQNVLAILTCLGVVGISEWLRTGHAIPKDRDSAHRVAIFLFALLVMPMNSFGSRDQLTFIFMWPMLALQAEDMAKDRKHSQLLYAGIGLLAGLGTSIKFYFVLGPIFGCLYVCYLKRSLKPIFGIENITAALFCLTYLGSIFWLHPAYIDFIYPMLAYAYFVNGYSFLFLTSNVLLILSVLYFSIIFLKKDPRLLDARTQVLLIATFGFVVSYYLFGRNLPFRFLPPATCLFMALAAADNHGLRSLNTKIHEMACLMVCAIYMYSSPPYPLEQFELIKSLRVEKPKLILLSGDLGHGHPLIRDLGGSLVNPGLFPWVSYGSAFSKRGPITTEEQHKIEQWTNWERDMTIAAWRRTPPDFIIIDTGRFMDMVEWASKDDFIVENLKDYVNLTQFGNALVMVKKSILDAKKSP